MIDLARALATAELRVLGRLPDASNVALLCEVHLHDSGRRCIYKPARGERPLWDFPGAVLSAREVLTAAASRCFAWDLIPETVWREDGPLGPGMCQEWIEATDAGPVGLFPAQSVPGGWCEVAEGRTPDGGVVVLAHEASAELQRLVVLDALVNNGDRKGGHLLRRPDGRLAAIDHGVTFHTEPKLRTVLWGWAGEPIPAWLLAEVAGGSTTFAATIATGPAQLSAGEVAAARARLDRLLDEATFPVPGEEWPALPWPPM